MCLTFELAIIITAAITAAYLTRRNHAKIDYPTICSNLGRRYRTTCPLAIYVFLVKTRACGTEGADTIWMAERTINRGRCSILSRRCVCGRLKRGQQYVMALK